MPSASQSPARRPPLNERTSSTHSLSSSGKPATNTAQKSHRAHKVSRHSRNISLGKGLGQLGRANSSTNVVASDGRQHQRKKSGQSQASPSQSPKVRAMASVMKRNSSHVALAKNTSHGNLRKNHSANALAIARNTSHPGLKKLGLAPAPKAKDEEEKKKGFFELGDHSSEEEEEEGEWEDSMTQSPEATRNNSKVSTPARVSTPLAQQVPAKSSEHEAAPPEKSSSPPQPSLKNPNRSLPDLRRDNIAIHETPHDPALLHQNPRSSRAPPAMSAVSALAAPNTLTRSDSTRSFTHISHADAESSKDPTMIGNSSSGDGGVSHFLSTSIPGKSLNSTGSPSETGSASNFMSYYRPQPSESPEKSRTLLNKARTPHIPSRTQQKLELQRREAMRAGAAPPATPPAPSNGMSFGSAVSLHSASGTRSRNRSLAGEIQAQKQDYETGIRQLTVVRRFRNPILESLNRLKERGVIPADTGAVTPAGAAVSKSRPQSRRGLSSAATANTTSTTSTTTGPKQQSRSHMVRGGSRVHFQREDSHDDIGGMAAAQESIEGALPEDEEQDGVSPEEALIRRLWESREVYDVDNNHSTSR